MATVDADEVRHVARLARLELEEDEVERLADELARILEHFESLRELELEDLPGPDGDGSALRPDVPGPDPMAAGPGREAPDWRDGFFVVPRLPGMEGPGGEGP